MSFLLSSGLSRLDQGYTPGFGETPVTETVGRPTSVETEGKRKP